jgi:hypothetical protein
LYQLKKQLYELNPNSATAEFAQRADKNHIFCLVMTTPQGVSDSLEVNPDIFINILKILIKIVD